MFSDFDINNSSDDNVILPSDNDHCPTILYAKLKHDDAKNRTQKKKDKRCLVLSFFFLFFFRSLYLSFFLPVPLFATIFQIQ